MLKYFRANKKDSLKKLQLILNTRKLQQQSQTAIVKNILLNVKKNGDKAVIAYERKFSKLNTKSTKIKFSKIEINKISRKIDKNLKQAIDVAFLKELNFFTQNKNIPLLTTLINLKINYLINFHQ